MEQAIDPGWKQDPQDPAILRWWDGQRWTAQTQPAAPPISANSTASTQQHEQAPTTELASGRQPAEATMQPAVNQVQGSTGFRGDVPAFYFDGGAATYVGTAILALLITVFTLGIMYPFALVLLERWKAKHTLIEGRRLVFTGTGMGLFGNWIKWLLLSIITLGIYLFWVRPRLTKWKVEHLAFDPTHQR